MKKIIFLTVATLFATFSFAQQQLATLNHNDSITVYYGIDALASAHSAAVNGDIITLSSGVFSNATITKEIIIRGNGMSRDTVAGTEPTIINSLVLNIPDDSSYQFQIEGLSSLSIQCNYAVAPVFKKCLFDYFYSSNGHGNQTEYTMNDAMFINCVIPNIRLYHSTGSQFVNSVVSFGGYEYPYGNCTLRNCIAQLMRSSVVRTYGNVAIMTCHNSILYECTPYNVSGNAVACYNCIGIYYGSGSGNYFNSCSNGNINYSSFSSVFKSYTLNDYTGIDFNRLSFELQDSIATSVLGNDGSQIGVYGGMVPFNTRINTPRYVNCSVAPHTTLDGKLSVDIEVVSE